MEIVANAVAGLHRAEQAVERVAGRLSRLPLSADPEPGQDEVVLSDEFVQLMEARTLFSANVKALHAGDEMNRNLLELLG